MPTFDPAPMMPITATSVITMEMLATTLTKILVFSRASMSSILVMVYAAIMTLSAGIIEFFQGATSERAVSLARVYPCNLCWKLANTHLSPYPSGENSMHVGNIRVPCKAACIVSQ